MAPRIKICLIVAGIVVPILILAVFGYSQALDAQARKAEREAFDAKIAALKPKLTKDRVLQIAQDYAAENKINLASYKPLSLSLFQQEERKLMWLISFEPKGIHANGTDWGLIVDDDTAELHILPGE